MGLQSRFDFCFSSVRLVELSLCALWATVPRVRGAATASDNANALCLKPNGCNEDHNRYMPVDCDGDGIEDHVCWSTKVDKRWMVLSTEGCPKVWGSYQRQPWECAAAFPELCIESEGRQCSQYEVCAMDARGKPRCQLIEYRQPDAPPPQPEEESDGMSMILVIVILVCSALFVLGCAYYVVNSFRDSDASKSSAPEDILQEFDEEKPGHVAVVTNEILDNNDDPSGPWYHDPSDVHEGHHSLPQSKGHAHRHASQHAKPPHLDDEKDKWHADAHVVPIDEHESLPNSAGHKVPRKNHPHFGATDGLPGRNTPLPSDRRTQGPEGLPSRCTPRADGEFSFRDHHNHHKHSHPQNHPGNHDQPDQNAHEGHHHKHHENQGNDDKGHDDPNLKNIKLHTHHQEHDHHNSNAHNHCHDHDHDIYEDRHADHPKNADNLGGYNHRAQHDS